MSVGLKQWKKGLDEKLKDFVNEFCDEIVEIIFFDKSIDLEKDESLKEKVFIWIEEKIVDQVDPYLPYDEAVDIFNQYPQYTSSVDIVSVCQGKTGVRDCISLMAADVLKKAFLDKLYEWQKKVNDFDWIGYMFELDNAQEAIAEELRSIASNV